MKAIILAAGMGSRIRPMTDHCHKSLLKVGQKTILEKMISHILNCEIDKFVIVLGYLQDQIKNHVMEKFPYLDVCFVTNSRYAKTNTGFSLMLAKEFVGNEGFLKFDGDVVFDKNILKKLVKCEYANCLCVDRDIELDAEGIKVIINQHDRIIEVNKMVNRENAVGESIGIEKISSETSPILFKELEAMMKNSLNHQAYYETAYEKLIKQKVAFHALNISGLSWTEIDTKDDYLNAIQKEQTYQLIH